MPQVIEADLSWQAGLRERGLEMASAEVGAEHDAAGERREDEVLELWALGLAALPGLGKPGHDLDGPSWNG